jgi:hypothetical protein
MQLSATTLDVVASFADSEKAYPAIIFQLGSGFAVAHWTGVQLLPKPVRNPMATHSASEGRTMYLQLHVQPAACHAVRANFSYEEGPNR